MDARFEIAQFSDFMREYNKLTEKCFSRCINNMNNRLLALDEISCVNNCISKHLNTSHKIMITYQKLQPAILEKRQREAEEKIKELLEKQQQQQQQQQQQETTIEPPQAPSS